MKRYLILLILCVSIVLLAIPADAQNPPRLQAIHNAADPGLAFVDVAIKIFGTPVFQADSIPFRAALPMVDAIAGLPLEVEVSQSGGPVVYSLTITLSNDLTYIGQVSGVVNPAQFAPNPDGQDISVNAYITSNGREVSTVPGEVQFNFFHGTTDAPTMDLLASSTGLLFDDVTYGDITSYASLPSDAYIIDLTDQSGTNILASFQADLSSYADSAMMIFTSGFMDPSQNQNGPEMGLFAALPSGNVIQFLKIGGFDKQIIANWNLLGLPLDVADPFYLSVFPNAVPGTLLGFNGASYFSEDTMQTCTGYWLRFPANEIAPVAGNPVDPCTINMAAGWNLIAGPSCDVALSNVSDPTGIMVPGTLYGFNRTYFLADTIKQGSGYWLRASSAGQISMTCGAFASSAYNSFAADIGDAVNQLPITITDGINSQVLAIGDDPQGTAGFDLGLDILAPPAPPAGAFDARLSWQGEDYFTDIRSDASPADTFVVTYKPESDLTGTPVGTIVINWDSTSFAGPDCYIITDNMTGNLFSLDMSTTSTLDIAANPVLDSGLRILVGQAQILGDVNDDGLANSTDALITLTYDAGLPLPPTFVDRINQGVGDVNSDGITNSTDGLILLSFDASLPVPFPVGNPVCL